MDEELSTNNGKEVENDSIKNPSHLKSIFQIVRQYFFQFFMLFLAVVSGFFAENMREEFSERKQAREYANSLLNELHRDRGNIEYHVSKLKETVNTITELATYAQSAKIEQLSNTELYRLTLIGPTPPFRWSLATIEQIKSSGSLRYFTNDSIVYYISRYNSWTIHLDQDNFQDQARILQAIEKRINVIDLNYTDEFTKRLKSNPDSLRKTKYFVDLESSKQLLTKDLNGVKSMVNAYLVVKSFSASRSDVSCGHKSTVLTLVLVPPRLPGNFNISFRFFNKRFTKVEHQDL